MQVAAARKTAEPRGHQFPKLARCVPQQRAESSVEPKLQILPTGEVENDQLRFERAPPQTASQLLKKDGRAFRRSEKEDRVDVGDIDAFVVDVDHAQHLHPSGVEVATSASSYIPGGPARQDGSAVPQSHKLVPNRFGMTDVYAECDRL